MSVVYSRHAANGEREDFMRKTVWILVCVVAVAIDAMTMALVMLIAWGVQ